MSGTIIESPYGVAPVGSPMGDAVRDQFYHDLMDILGDVRLLWVPQLGESTGSTDRSRNARTITYSKDVTTYGNHRLYTGLSITGHRSSFVRGGLFYNF